MRYSTLLIGLLACDDTLFPPSASGPTPSTAAGEGWCQVRATFEAECLACHSAAARLGGLDLETDAHAALVGVESSGFPGRVLVAAGDPEGSLLYRKLRGTQAASEGTEMPPGRTLGQPAVAAVGDWIAAGATEDCGTSTTTPGGTGGTVAAYHPDGWDSPGVHGLAAKLQTEADCRTCHGEALDGGSAGVACDDCHTPAWETTCTYCHGGVADTTGAPPEDIDDEAVAVSFPAHPAHVAGTTHRAADCDDCHAKPADALAPGHLFDDATPAVAEVDLGGGLSPDGAYDGNGGCSNLYCHGTGRANGDVAATATASCHLCHADWTRTGFDWWTMGGQHDRHLGEGFACSECHGEVVDGSGTIVGPALHVDGTVQTRFPAGFTFDGHTCTGDCHGEGHGGRTW